MNVYIDRPYATIHHFWMGVRHVRHVKRMQLIKQFADFMVKQGTIVAYILDSDPSFPAIAIRRTFATKDIIMIPLQIDPNFVTP